MSRTKITFIIIVCAAVMLIFTCFPSFASGGVITMAETEARQPAGGAESYVSTAAAEAADINGSTDAVISGLAQVVKAGGADALAPNASFSYRYKDEMEERREYEERKRRESEEAWLAAEEERRLNELRQRVASLTNDDLDELYSAEYFTERMRVLGYLRSEYGADINYRNAVIRLQAAMNLRTDAVLGENTKKALLENSPVIPHDEVSSPASGGYWITINKSKNILTIYEGAKVYGKYPVATGSSPSLTPEGKFSIVTKAVNPAWGGGGYASPVAGGAPGNPLGKRWFGLSVGGGGSYGVHGNANAASIGTYASHGCVRMINADVEKIFEFISVGTPVWIGSDAKLADFGIKQYHTVTQAPGDALPAFEPEPAPDFYPADPERATLIAYDDGL